MLSMNRYAVITPNAVITLMIIDLVGTPNVVITLPFSSVFKISASNLENINVIL